MTAGPVPHDGRMDISETLLPGVGLRYELTTVNGDHIGLVVARHGEVTLLCYADDDPDASFTVARLTREESEAVADLLGAPRLAERFADLSREVPGLMAAQIEITAESPFAGRTVADTRARTLTGVSIVAVFTEGKVLVSPDPDTRLPIHATLVVMGSEDGINALQHRIAG